MKTIMSNKIKHDDCLKCESKLVSFDGNRVICPACAAAHISKLERENAKLKDIIKMPVAKEATHTSCALDCQNCDYLHVNDKIYPCLECEGRLDFVRNNYAPAPNPTPKVTDVLTFDGVIEGLEYISSSPPQEHGGFHPQTILIAKSALAFIRSLAERAGEGYTVAFSNVIYERKRQDAKWGEKNHRPEKWLTILLEELGEAAKALLEQTAMKYRDEMVHVASVAVAAIEAFDKNNPQDGHNTEITQSIDRLIQNIEESK